MQLLLTALKAAHMTIALYYTVTLALTETRKKDAEFSTLLLQDQEKCYTFCKKVLKV